MEWRSGRVANFCKSLKCPTAAPSELHALEHLKHVVEHGQHDHVALHQPASVQGCSLRISDYLSCQALWEKVKVFVTGDFCNYKFRCVQWPRYGGPGDESHLCFEQICGHLQISVWNWIKAEHYVVIQDLSDLRKQLSIRTYDVRMESCFQRSDKSWITT